MLGFDLVGEVHVLQNFKNMQRSFAQDTFSLEKIKSLFAAIFAFHPQRTLSKSVGGYTEYSTSGEVDENHYKDSHKKYYRDMAGLLVELGVSEIKKNLHPENDKPLINSLDLAVNMIKRMDYQMKADS